MLSSAGTLLRAWRMEYGWSQAEVGHRLYVSTASVSAWERDSRRIPSLALAQLDDEYDAGGCLVDLVRAIGTPHGHDADENGLPVTGPRRYWPRVFTGDDGPAWVWIRGVDRARLGGYLFSGPLGMSFELPPAPETASGPGGVKGVFVPLPWWPRIWPLHVVLHRPGWVDFGRGVPPGWIDGPALVTRGVDSLELLDRSHRQVDYFATRVCELDNGDPATLAARMRDLLGHDVWDRLLRGWRHGSPLPGAAHVSGETAAADRAGAAPGIRQPSSAEERRVAHRLLRERRGLTQAEAAALANKILGGDQVSEHQIYNYEAGRHSRIRHLPAVLDLAYEAGGWSCFESTRVRRVMPDRYEVDFPAWWAGPVTIRIGAAKSPNAEGILKLSTDDWHNDRLVGSQAAAFTYCRVPNTQPLQVGVPSLRTVRAFMGQDASAIDANPDWLPTPAHADDAVGAYLAATMTLIGRTKADLDRALNPALTRALNRAPVAPPRPAVREEAVSTLSRK
jgi:transcriptional regulator with XRE-family HTH domain